MEKLLTVSVAAYNVAEYIRGTLDSVLHPECLDALEILVVDDGGTDETLSIVREYEKQYPGTVIGIHKENGGYGSVINTSIARATGKYFKQLDGDDWFEKENLPGFLAFLKDKDADYVATPMRMFNEADGSQVIRDYFENTPQGVYPFDEMAFQSFSPMHCSAFRTALLKENNITITEHCFYTDVELVNRPLPYFQTIGIYHAPIYVYRVGREGQSVSRTGVRKHYKEHEKVFWNLLEIYQSLDPEQTAKREFLLRRLVKETATQMKYYCYLKRGKGPGAELKAFGTRLKQEAPELLAASMEYSRFVRLMVKTNYLAYHISGLLL